MQGFFRTGVVSSRNTAGGEGLGLLLPRVELCGAPVHWVQLAMLAAGRAGQSGGPARHMSR